jgi:hypothetical protein
MHPPTDSQSHRNPLLFDLLETREVLFLHRLNLSVKIASANAIGIGRSALDRHRIFESYWMYLTVIRMFGRLVVSGIAIRT